MSVRLLTPYVVFGTAAERAAFPPGPPTPPEIDVATGQDYALFWLETDTSQLWVWESWNSPGAWLQLAAGAAPGPIPSFRSVGTIAAANAIGATISPGLPTGWQQDDIFVLITECNSADTVPVPSGWTESTASPQSDATGTTTKLQVFTKRAGSSESAPSVTRVGDHTVGLIAAFTGCTTTGDPVNAAAGGSGAGTAVTVPGITTTVENCLVLDIVGHGIDSNVGSRLSGWTNGDLASPSINEAAGADLAQDAAAVGVWPWLTAVRRPLAPWARRPRRSTVPPRGAGSNLR